MAAAKGKGKGKGKESAGKGKQGVKRTPPDDVETPPEKPRKQRKCEDPKFQLQLKDVAVPEKSYEENRDKPKKTPRATREKASDAGKAKADKKHKKQKIVEGDQEEKPDEEQDEHVDQTEHEDEEEREEEEQEDDEHVDQDHHVEDKEPSEEQKEDNDGGRKKRKARFLTLQCFSLKSNPAVLSFDIDVSKLSSKQTVKAFETILPFGRS